MAEYDNTNSGALFKNDKKATDKHPDYRGTINVDGVEYWLSSWLKKSGAGATFMSLSVQPKEAQQAPQRAPEPAFRKPSQDAFKARQVAPARGSDHDQFDDDQTIPF